MSYTNLLRKMKQNTDLHNVDMKVNNIKKIRVDEMLTAEIAKIQGINAYML